MSKPPGQFAEWLREKLAERGYLERGGQTAFARQAGIHLSILSRALNEDRVPEIEALRAMGRVLGYTLGEMMIAAGVAGPEEMPTRTSVTSSEAIAVLQREADAEGKPLGEVLLERGVDAHQLVIPDAPPMDDQIAEIMAMKIPEDSKQRMIRMYLENRAMRFEQARQAAERLRQERGE